MSEPDRITAHEEITTHVADGLDLLAREFRKDRIEAILTAWLSQVQHLEGALFDLLSDGLTTAVGAQLDQIGDLLGRPRAGLSDDEYRLVLQGTALAISSSGTGPEIYAIADILCKTVTFTLTEPPVATVKIEPDAALPISATLVLEVLARAKAAGVRLLLVDPRGASSTRFTFASGTETITDAARGLSDVAASTGGRLVGILES